MTMDSGNQVGGGKRPFNTTISHLKAFCIMMVVLGHCNCSIEYVMQFLGMFRMPLFFFVSGYCFKKSSLDNPGRYFYRRFKGVYWPFVKWCLVFMLLHNIFIHIELYNAETPRYGFIDYISQSFYIIGHMLETEQLMGAYWFLAALFAGSIMSWVIMKLIPKIEVGAIVALLIAIVFNSVQDYLPLDNPIFKFIPFSYILISARTFQVAFLIIAGHWFADKKIKAFGWITILFITIITFVGSFYWRINTGLMFFENSRFIPYQVTGVLFTWCLYSFFSHWKETESFLFKTMTYIGRNTLTVLTWHFISFKLVSLLIIAIYGLPYDSLSEFPVIHEYAAKGWWLAYFSVSMLICCGIAYCNKWIKSSWLKL